MDSSRYPRLFTWALILSFLCLLVTPTELGEEVRNVFEDEEEPWDAGRFKDEADEKYSLLFHKYNPRIRPPDLYVKVDLSVTLSHFRYLDVVKQELQTVLDLEMNWVDSRLRWLPYKVKEIYESTDQVWCPDLVYINGVAPLEQLYPNIVRIIHNGSVSWIRKEIVTTRCKTDPSSNVQSCAIQIGFMANSLDSNDQDTFYFSDKSLVNAPDGNFLSHNWQLSSIEMKFEEENETKSSTVDLDLLLEKTNTGSGGHHVADSTITTDGVKLEDGRVATGGDSSGQRGNCDCNAVDSPTRVCNVVLVLVCVIWAWLVDCMRGGGR